MSAPILIRNFTAGTGGVREGRIVRLGATDGEVVETTAVGDTLLGVSVQPGTATAGQRVDVAVNGIVEAVAGGAIARGAWLTTDAAGRAVAAAPAAGINNGVVGIALVAAAANDIFPVLLVQGRIQG